MFLRDDIYTSSGSLKLYHCWNDKVTKFDPSSFYNWEQDNLPIYDLEERTSFLWEQLGYPASSVPGIALVVSADAPDYSVTCNKNIFRSVSAALEALPKVINFPVLIEIANFGQLGDIKLNNIKFGSKGSLEIINRNFARSESTVTFNGSYYVPASKYIVNTNSNFSKYNLASGVSGYNYYNAGGGDTAFSNFDFGPRKHFLDSSCLSISSTVFSGTLDSRLSGSGGNLNGYVKYPSNISINRSTLIIGGDNAVNPYGEINGYNSRVLNFRPYELGANSSDGVNTYDVSTTDFRTSNHLYYTLATPTGANDVDAGRQTNGLFYGNKCSKIIITECDGPIYLRNFFVDGSGSLVTNNNYGVEVNNCTNIYLENIVSTRNRKAGFLFNNSNVTLLRGCVGTRNYDFDSNSNRVTQPWQNRRLNITSSISDDIGAGLLAYNSNILVSSTSGLEENYIVKELVRIFAKEGITVNEATVRAVYNSIAPNHYATFDFSRNSNGIILNNSNLIGGNPETRNDGYAPITTMPITIEGNTSHGLRLLNSSFTWYGRLYCYENLIGVFSESSMLQIDKSLFGLHQNKGIDLYNSTVKYNINKKRLSLAEDRSNNYVFSGNAQHIVANNSKVYPEECSSIHSINGRMRFTNPIVNSLDYATRLETIPSVDVKNNSDVVLIHPSFIRNVNESDDYSVGKGCEISSKNSSKVTLKGSGNYATKLFGPNDYKAQYKLAAIYATDNSIVEINGPTVIGQYGVDLLAENNSILNINPHKTYTNQLDISGFDLSNKSNHTAVELHSTRSCIVVNKNSILNVKDLGSYNKNWSRTSFGSNELSKGSDYTIQNDMYFSGGSLQLYPNPNTTLYSDSIKYPTDSLNSTYFSDTLRPSFSSVDAKSLLYFFPEGPEGNSTNTYSSLTLGGMCVRAANSSLVNLLNVNFPCGWWIPSGIYYNAESANGLCDKLFIWNISDDSKLNSSYLSVSGLYPADAGYFGPSGDWGNSGLPSSTPDTSTISVLDYFGKTTRNPFGKSVSAENYGPFRLYFGVNPVVDLLEQANVLTTGLGIVKQIYSQGYQPSAYVSAVDYFGTNYLPSSLYPMLVQRLPNGTLSTSAYYHASSMVINSTTNKCILDRSSSETFANAKHCSVGKSGLAKICTIYLPYYNTSKGDSFENLGGYGIRSINQFDLEKIN